MTAIFFAIAVFQTDQDHKVNQRQITKDVMQDARPVNCDEAYSVFTTARGVMGKALKCDLGSTTFAKSSKTASREQIVGEMTSILHGLEPKIKFTPPAMKVAPSVLKIAKPQEKDLETLIRKGYVGRVAPLATNSKDSLTVKQFGDALGLFMTRAAEVTRYPSAKWTPILGAGG